MTNQHLPQRHQPVIWVFVTAHPQYRPKLLHLQQCRLNNGGASKGIATFGFRRQRHFIRSITGHLDPFMDFQWRVRIAELAPVAGDWSWAHPPRCSADERPARGVANCGCPGATWTLSLRAVTSS